MTKVEQPVKEFDHQENRKDTVTHKFSIEPNVTFWLEYFNTRRPKRQWAKPIEAEPGVDDGVII
jgi:hypothetical protein